MKKPIYLSPGAKLWLYLCCFMNTYTIVSYAMQGYYYNSVTLGIVVIGYLMLLFLHSRWGYVVAVGISLVTVLLTFPLMGLTALLALFQPALTWFFIKNDWKNDAGSREDMLARGMRELALNAQPKSEEADSAHDARPEREPEPEIVYTEPPQREDLAKTMADISEAIHTAASEGADGAAREQARDYLLTKGRMSRVKIVQYIKSRFSGGDFGFNYAALLDVMDGLGLADSADVWIDLLTREPFSGHAPFAALIADRLIALDCRAVSDKLSERGAESEAAVRVLDHYRMQ